MIDYDVGDLVVCVDDTPHPNRPTLVCKGLVYVVQRLVRVPFGVHPIYGDSLGVGVFIEGVNPFAENGFHPARFRKLPRKSQSFFAGETQENHDLISAQ